MRQDVPLQRVIGAFLVGTGINWKAVVTNGAELVIGGMMAMSRDSIRLESPAAQEELALLKSMKVGDVRRGVLSRP